MTAAAHAWAQEQILAPLREALQRGEMVDGVLLALHGAMVAEGEEDPEGALLEACCHPGCTNETRHRGGGGSNPPPPARALLGPRGRKRPRPLSVARCSQSGSH